MPSRTLVPAAVIVPRQYAVATNASVRTGAVTGAGRRSAQAPAPSKAASAIAAAHVRRTGSGFRRLRFIKSRWFGNLFRQRGNSPGRRSIAGEDAIRHIFGRSTAVDANRRTPFSTFWPVHRTSHLANGLIDGTGRLACLPLGYKMRAIVASKIRFVPPEAAWRTVDLPFSGSTSRQRRSSLEER